MASCTCARASATARARVSEREYVDARGEPGRSLPARACGCESVYVSARAEGPVALAEEPEARA